MQPSEIRNLSDGELEVRTRELEEQLFLLQLRRATSQLENPMKVRAVRRDLARCRTIHRERAKAS
ncbi:MAG: 50S ribosomal protein L29 [Deltaproteobacteria bacterium]|nr:MAG: 50S ribosomal protein L29 [Deltaproteobacteria bacterium]